MGGSREGSRCCSAEEIESCASSSNSVRSSRENSWRETSGKTTTGGELCSGGDIGIVGRLRFAATAENKSAAATALGAAPVDLRPESGKVIDRGNQRDTNHKPDRGVSNPMHRKNEVSVNRPLFPAMIENHRDHGNNLHYHLELAQFTGLDGETTGGGDGSQAAYQKLAADNEDGDPCRNQAGIELDESNESGCD